MYFFGFVGAGLLIYVLKTGHLSDVHVFALAVGGLFVNVAGWLHGSNQTREHLKKQKTSGDEV